MSGPARAGAEPRTRKRQGTMRVCRECRGCKRIKVAPPSDDSPVCSSCRRRSSEADADRDAPPLHPCSSATVGERLEMLFEKFLTRRSAGWRTGPERNLCRPSGKGKEKESRADAERRRDAETSSILSEKLSLRPSRTSHSSASMPTLVDVVEASPVHNADGLRRELVALLPSQHDADVLWTSGAGWKMVHHTLLPCAELFIDGDAMSHSFDIALVSKEHPLVIARTLLVFALCISSLPPDFDPSRLTAMASLDDTMRNIVHTVTYRVASSDENVCTLPGLEILFLFALFHLTTASLRLAWLAVRRAFNLAHLMGFHRIVSDNTPSPDSEAIMAAKFLWRQLVDTDRYLSLHLRLPLASEDYPIQSTSCPTANHRAHLMRAARQVSELSRAVSPQAYVDVVALDERLDAVAADLPACYWELPPLAPAARSAAAAATLDRVLTQLWHFELKIFLHLPFLLRAPLDARFGYSKISALQACRSLVVRYLALRRAGLTQIDCRVADPPAFLAAAALALDVVADMAARPRAVVERARCPDFALVCSAAREMAALAARSPREPFAARAAPVLRRLLTALDPAAAAAAPVRVTMPYFGAVELAPRAPPVRRGVLRHGDDHHNGADDDDDDDDARPPVFAFMDNALWPGAAGVDDEWGPAAAAADGFDFVLFDGLADLDTDGNWVF